jgi:hypothetical protein
MAARQVAVPRNGYELAKFENSTSRIFVPALYIFKCGIYPYFSSGTIVFLLLLGVAL